MFGTMFALGVGYALGKSRRSNWGSFNTFVLPQQQPQPMGFAPYQQQQQSAFLPQMQQFSPMLSPQQPAFTQPGQNPYGPAQSMGWGITNPAAPGPTALSTPDYGFGHGGGPTPFANAMQSLAQVAMQAAYNPMLNAMFGGWPMQQQMYGQPMFPQPQMFPLPQTALPQTALPQTALPSGLPQTALPSGLPQTQPQSQVPPSQQEQEAKARAEAKSKEAEVDPAAAAKKAAAARKGAPAKDAEQMSAELEELERKSNEKHEKEMLKVQEQQRAQIAAAGDQLKKELNTALKLTEAELRELPASEMFAALKLQVPHVREPLERILEALDGGRGEEAERLIQGLSAHCTDTDSQWLDVLYQVAAALPPAEKPEVKPELKAPSSLPAMHPDKVEANRDVLGHMLEQSGFQAQVGSLGGRETFVALEAKKSTGLAPQRLAQAGIELIRLARREGEIPKAEIDAWIGFEHAFNSDKLKAFAKDLAVTTLTSAQQDSTMRTQMFIAELLMRKKAGDESEPEKKPAT
jgi:hypothetical protein